MTDAARRAGADVAAFREAYWRHRLAYDAELPAPAYWRRVLAEARPAGPVLDDPGWLIAADVASWTIYRDPVWEVAADFRAGGGRTALLSNSGPDVMARVRADGALERCRGSAPPQAGKSRSGPGRATSGATFAAST